MGIGSCLGVMGLYRGSGLSDDDLGYLGFRVCFRVYRV